VVVDVPRPESDVGFMFEEFEHELMKIFFLLRIRQNLLIICLFLSILIVNFCSGLGTTFFLLLESSSEGGKESHARTRYFR
jgi:hypothetical protein